MFRAPAWVYRVGLGWMLGKRFLAVTHRGRKSGREHETILEVLKFDPGTQESVVVSAYGPSADWYRNLQAEPAVRVRTGGRDYAPEQRFLSSGEARDVAAEFCRRHPWEARLAPRVLPAIGANVPAGSRSPIDLLATLPMVALRPKE